MSLFQLYIPLAVLLVLIELLLIWQVFRNCRYSLSNPWEHRGHYAPKALVTVPCKGIDHTFAENIGSVYALDYEDYMINFVVEDESDPAHAALVELRDKLLPGSKASSVNILTASKAKTNSQKLHNMLCSIKHSIDEVEVLAFADSDACLPAHWLSHLAKPLRQKTTALTSGYRWFVPLRNNIPTLAMSAGNAKVAQFLGKYQLNQAWGGSMAIKAETFVQLGMMEIWENVLSDDLTISWAVKKADRKVAYVASCLVASYEDSTWKKATEFTRRQFLITKVCTPFTWWISLLGTFYTSIAGVWLGLTMAVWAVYSGVPYLYVYIAVPVVHLFGHVWSAVLRQIVAFKRLEKDRRRLMLPAIMDLLFSPIWSTVMFFMIFSSAFGRTITWRGIRYKLVSPTKTEILSRA